MATLAQRSAVQCQHRADNRAVNRPSAAALRLTSFRGDTTTLRRRSSGAISTPRQYSAKIYSFKFLKNLGLKKPEFLPDFGKDKRLALLNSFFNTNDKATLEGLLSDEAQIVEQGSQTRTYNKSEFVNLLCNHVVPAIPDFNWGHSTDGAADKEGYALVTCQATGQHTGKPLRIPGSELPKVEPQQKKFTLGPAELRVKVADSKIQEIILPANRAGFKAIYEAVGGKTAVA